MKKNIKTFALCALVVSGLTSTTYAGVIGNALYDSKGNTSTVRILGSGDHTLKGYGTAGNTAGTASVKQVVEWGIDKIAASTAINGLTPSSKVFVANSLTSNGGDQGYYINWSPDLFAGNKSAYIEVSH